MLIKFGGHPMAAGLAVDSQRIPEFRRALSTTVLEMLGGLRDRPGLQIDGYVRLADLSLDLVEDLERLAPFGPGNPSLTLASKGLSLASYTTVGRNGEHLQLIVQDDEGATHKVIWWEGAGSPLPQSRFDLAYVVRASDYRSQRDIQLQWVDVRQIEEHPVGLRYKQPAVEIVDYRRAPNPRKLLEGLLAKDDTQVWCEGDARAEIGGQGRHELSPAKGLVIWTAPPGLAELRTVLERVSPQVVYLFAIDPGFDHPQTFLKRLSGLIKYALRSHDGRVSVASLAAATAQREVTVGKGIAWLAARGDLLVLGEDGNELRLREGNHSASADLPQIVAQLKNLLEETAAYRAHFAQADNETLI
jgi:single-stranded-DNA-specific exonuclease